MTSKLRLLWTSPKHWSLNCLNCSDSKLNLMLCQAPALVELEDTARLSFRTTACGYIMVGISWNIPLESATTLLTARWVWTANWRKQTIGMASWAHLRATHSGLWIHQTWSVNLTSHMSDKYGLKSPTPCLEASLISYHNHSKNLLV